MTPQQQKAKELVEKCEHSFIRVSGFDINNLDVMCEKCGLTATVIN